MDLGEHIELTDFTSDPSAVIVLKKLVGNHVKHLTETTTGFERLTLVHKGVHGTKHEIHGTLALAGKSYFAETTDHNVFFALDACLKKLRAQVRN